LFLYFFSSVLLSHLFHSLVHSVLRTIIY
jgi:hypothetical protein